MTISRRTSLTSSFPLVREVGVAEEVGGAVAVQDIAVTEVVEVQEVVARGVVAVQEVVAVGVAAVQEVVVGVRVVSVEAIRPASAKATRARAPVRARTKESCISSE